RRIVPRAHARAETTGASAPTAGRILTGIRARGSSTIQPESEPRIGARADACFERFAVGRSPQDALGGTSRAIDQVRDEQDVAQIEAAPVARRNRAGRGSRT